MRERLPIIISADPGYVSGWSVFIPGNLDERYYLWRYGEMSPTESSKVYSFFQEIGVKALETDRAITLVTESQFLNPKDKLGFKLGSKTTIGLVMNRARWQVVAELLGFKVVMVSPLKWQHGLLNATPKVPSKIRKERSQNFVKYLFSLDSVREHEADAICLAIHEIRMSLVPVSKEHRPLIGDKL